MSHNSGRAAALFYEGLVEGIGWVPLPVYRHNVCAAPQKLLHVRGADASSSAGNGDDLARKVLVHGVVALSLGLDAGLERRLLPLDKFGIDELTEL